MPCHDPDSSLMPQVLSARVNHLTRMLCGICSILEKENSSLLDGDLLEWWNAHKSYDSDLAAAKDRLSKVGWIGELSEQDRWLIYNEGR